MVLDVFSRRVVGWAMADHLPTELVVDALDMAIWNRRPQPGLVHHSDQGCQGGFKGLRSPAARGRLVASMGSVGDCFDNAVTESFFATRAQARTAVFDYLEGFYNRIRRHSTLGYLSPADYERSYQAASTSAQP